MTTATEPDRSDITALEGLNQEYIDAFMNADVEWYRQHLSEDFLVIESDGSVLNKEEFLTNTERGPDVIDYNLQEVSVRIYGDVALVRATGLWTRQDGSKGRSRYIDVYVKSEAAWKVVSAQITRSAVSTPSSNESRRL